jgi:ABC-type spermidine/putrescine transport system permease subunit II
MRSGPEAAHRHAAFTVHNFAEVLEEEIVARAFINSFVIATLAS